MAEPAISVIVVSRDRPDWLRRCLLAVRQLDYPRFETIVVACPKGAAVAREAAGVRVIDFDRANISEARNAGITLARGEVLAFIDDDAVPEPTWLAHLAGAFDAPEVQQAGGVTLGRNGISLQHGAARVDASGVSHPAAIEGDSVCIVAPEDDRLPRLHGTNMALRRSAVERMYGFDPRFAFYLDETDLTYRISRSGGQTAFVPKAIVHHASGPSRYRDADRTPRHVFEIAASAAVFHAKHTPQADRDRARAEFLTDRRHWILRHMQRGGLTPDQAWRMIRDLKAGYAEGFQRPQSDPVLQTLHHLNDIFQKESEARDVCLVVDHGRSAAARAKSKSLVAQGHRVTVLDYTHTARFHHVRFVDEGYWLHTGGIFGRELRDEPVFRMLSKAERVRRTQARLHGIRSKKMLDLDH
ncbi:MAG: glycosyltransferase [Marivita sp.]|uniref:glycosyltransferase family 2 protein n=1 Tax=Marivita sp. TaxID=2003365 RepID=UPI0025BF4E4A|nr:glycosyltransferase [Marivita sp.]MCI5109669.1 glycosyltransferase [Marivita sp.]